MAMAGRRSARSNPTGRSCSPPSNTGMAWSRATTGSPSAARREPRQGSAPKKYTQPRLEADGGGPPGENRVPIRPQVDAPRLQERISMRVAGSFKLVAIGLAWPRGQSARHGPTASPSSRSRSPCRFFEAPRPGRDGLSAGQRARSLGSRAHRRWPSSAGGSRQEGAASRDRDGDGTAGRPAAHLRQVPGRDSEVFQVGRMARDSEGNYYLVGSHSGKTQGERDEHAKLIRFRLRTQPGTAGSFETVTIDDGSVISWRLASPLIQALQHEGLNAKSVDERKIEGLAIRELPAGPDGRVRRELVIGLRQPDDLVRAFVADITVPSAPDIGTGAHALFAFDAGDREGVALPVDVAGVPRRPGRASWSSRRPRTNRTRFMATRSGSCLIAASHRAMAHRSRRTRSGPSSLP